MMACRQHQKGVRHKLPDHLDRPASRKRVRHARTAINFEIKFCGRRAGWHVNLAHIGIRGDDFPFPAKNNVSHFSQPAICNQICGFYISRMCIVGFKIPGHVKHKFHHAASSSLPHASNLRLYHISRVPPCPPYFPPQNERECALAILGFESRMGRVACSSALLLHGNHAT